MPDQEQDVREVTPEVVPTAIPGALVSQRPTEGGIMDLIANEERAVELVKARAATVSHARRAAISVTTPEDWVFFRDYDGRETGYLQDAGADRVRDIMGIEVFNIRTPQRIPEKPVEGEAFTYIVIGDGRCKLTGQIVEAMEGGRASTDDFIVKQKEESRPKGANLELLVRKSARANLDGNITRELAGLKTVPIQEVVDAWKDQPKKDVRKARVGRGYGTEKWPGSSLRGSSPAPRNDQRQQQGAPPAESLPDYTKDFAPTCEKHNVDMQLVPAGVSKKSGNAFSAFWTCPQGKADCKTLDALSYHNRLVKERDGDGSSSSNTDEREPGAD